MAVKTFHLLDSLASSSNHHAMQDGGSPPTAATIGTGWIIGLAPVTPDIYARMSSRNIRARATLNSTPQPNGPPDDVIGDCARSQNRITGDFVDGEWLFSIDLSSISAAENTSLWECIVDYCGGQANPNIRIRVRLWKGNDPKGTDAVEISDGAVPGSDSIYIYYFEGAYPAFGLNSVCLGSISPGPVSFVEEYLFVQPAIDTEGDLFNESHSNFCDGTPSDEDVSLAVGSFQSGYWLKTPEFSAAVPLSLTGIPSSEAMGSLIAGLNLAGIGTSEALGPLHFGEVILLTGIGSSEAMGAMIAGLNLAGISTSEALGSLIAGLNLTGIPSSEAMGTLFFAVLESMGAAWLMVGHDSGLNQRVYWWAATGAEVAPPPTQTIPPYTGALSQIAVEIPPWALGGANASVIAPAPPGPFYDTAALAAGELGVLVAGTGMLLAKANASTAAGSLIAGAYSGIPGLMILSGMVEGALFTTAGGAPAVNALVFAAPADEEALASGKFSATIPGVTAGSGKYVAPVGICAGADDYSTTRRCRVILRIAPRIGPM